MENTAVILCRDVEFSRLLLRHTEPFCAVTEALALPDVCRFAVIDLDSFPHALPSGFPSILFSRKALSPSSGIFLRRPFLLSEYEAHVADLIGEGRHTAQRFVLAEGCRAVTVGGKTFHLSDKEARLLAVLARTPNSPVSRDALRREVFPDKTNSALNVYICYLRKKLESDGVRRLFSTRNGGYTLSPDGGKGKEGDGCSI